MEQHGPDAACPKGTFVEWLFAPMHETLSRVEESGYCFVEPVSPDFTLIGRGLTMLSGTVQNPSNIRKLNALENLEF